MCPMLGMSCLVQRESGDTHKSHNQIHPTGAQNAWRSLTLYAATLLCMPMSASIVG